jgi:hypothetical protein
MGRAEACAGHQHGPERWNWKREKIEVEVIANFQCWLKNPDVRDLVCQNYISPEERERRLREIFGLEPKAVKTEEEMAEETAGKIHEIYGLPPKSPEPPESLGEADSANPAVSESNLVKPSQTK